MWIFNNVIKANLQEAVALNAAAIKEITETDIAGLETDIEGLQSDLSTLDSAALKRTTTQTAPTLVSLSLDGAQQNLKLGEHLTITDDTIDAAGGGGTPVLYHHNLHVTDNQSNNYQGYFHFLSTSATSIIDMSDLPLNTPILLAGTIMAGDLDPRRGGIFWRDDTGDLYDISINGGGGMVYPDQWQSPSSFFQYTTIINDTVTPLLSPAT